MASDMIAAQHTWEVLLKFILPDDTVTVDLEGMTLTGVHVYKRDKNCIENVFFLGARRIDLLLSSWERLGKPKEREIRNF